MFSKIISGGQTGADRAGLDVAIEMGVPHGGYCPKDRKAEDGRIDDKYNLIEFGSYRDRTIKNIESADLTIVFYKGQVTTGTALTIDKCGDLNKKLFRVDFNYIVKDMTPILIRDLLTQSFGSQPITVNIAGSRESKCPGIYELTRGVLLYLLK